METGDNQGMLSKNLAFSKRERENDAEIETSNLLDFLNTVFSCFAYYSEDEG
ncbi:MAG: hypothetical protein RR448_03710 [Niameybacter sp.]|uniref:hypothetical protein n=1 Tax=Niameybacter sp. TaxID=2033640 RepID=UPI002FC8D7E3